MTVKKSKPLNITKRLAADLSKPYWCRFWGQRRLCKPVFIQGFLGDGMKLISVTPTSTRPNYYLIRVDSSWSDSNYDSPCIADNLDEIYEAIEDEVGPGGQLSEYQSGTGRARFEPWPGLSADCGCSWGNASDLLPKRLRLKSA